ncbi:FAST kinase domain-containing protein 3, mitochondrial [Denticeps clupeoides]|uniref:RAP domain-containing protein n=1 Tax=Denticeps clupeoides TaxID=299321 RepID=A0AAY3ZYE7_9TELE|nr:FAST kinase domain-containing protein 3, mitochondrial [Denticeps clupeoides]XP_028826021.1 FAST kinase domain-containing protein 3, mitochondrial [Denticeps clupeoides]XP_028826022.1 FAST kinase domain-containing protein 3, mitochondrial [Denticeps clupeoides]XP_028826023.1 FAST kinase domain-containing protein 3, mitochondrial [Denticeps clupeoides]
MALKVLRRVLLLRTRLHSSVLVSWPRLLTAQPTGGGVCLWTFSGRRSLQQGSLQTRRSTSEAKMGVCTAIREPPFAARPRRDSLLDGVVCLSMLQQPSLGEERAFHQRLSACASSRQVLRLLRSLSPPLSDSMAAAVLHRLADLEQDGMGGLQDPEVLSDPALRAVCQQLEQESRRLSNAALVSVLLGCTRLYLDPWSRLMVRLVSESQERLDGVGLGVGELCVLARALLALEGPDCAMLVQVVEQLQRGDPSLWSLTELTGVYGALGAGVARGGRYQNLLNTMHTHALPAAARLEPAAVSDILGALVALDQSQALPLVIALCKQAVRHVPVFTDAQLVAVLSALMHFGHSDHFLVQALERHVPKTAFTASPEMVTKVAQYFSRRAVWSPAVFDAVAESFVYRADEYSTDQAARQLAALGTLGYVPPNAGQLFRKVEVVLHARFSQFQPWTLLELLHACTLLQRFPLNFVSRVFSPYFLQQLQEQGRGSDRVVLAQLTQLYMTVKLECPSYNGPRLLPKYRVKSFLMAGQSLETQVDPQLYNSVKSGLVDLLGARSYFASKVLTPYCYTLDVEIKLDEEGYVLPANHVDDVYKRIAVCVDGPKRFAVNERRLLGREAMKQRHLMLLGYEVVQIPHYEFEELKGRTETVEYLHKKIFPLSYRLSW